MPGKPLHWIGSSKSDLKEFPDEARRKAGLELRVLQQGSIPSDFKPMRVIGKGVEEIRIQAEGAYRVFYIARFEEAVYVLHAFQKKTQKTSLKDIELGQKRYKQVLQQRETEEENND